MDWNAIASIATAAGVAFAAWQIRQSSKIAQSQFEDALDSQYRALVMVIPVDALIGKPVPMSSGSEVRECIYNYLDLSNEQTYLRRRKRIRADVWADWSSGMRDHLSKPAFATVWDEVKRESPGTFSWLERLERSGFAEDPYQWKADVAR